MFLVAFLIGSAVSLQLWDGQFADFTTAFYFTFTSTATIGLGDLMPQPQFLLSIMIFLMFGMAVLSWFVSSLYAMVRERIVTSLPLS